MVSKAPLSNELYFSPIFDARELRGTSCRPSGQGWEDIIGVPKVWGSVTEVPMASEYQWACPELMHRQNRLRKPCCRSHTRPARAVISGGYMVVTGDSTTKKRSSVLKSPAPHGRTYGAGSSGGGRPGRRCEGRVGNPG